MASEQGGVSTATPVFSANISGPPTVATTTDTNAKVASEPTRGKSLKRGRPDSLQQFEGLTPIANTGLVDSPSPKSPRFKGGFAPGYHAAPLTGAAALEDERRRKEESQRSQSIQMSENPGHKVMSSLLASGGTAMSKPTDAPVATTAMSEGMSAAASAISIPSPILFDDKAETSPASITSLASLGSTAQTATASPTVVASPAAMATGPDDSATPNVHHLGTGGRTEEQPSNRALTFPGNVLGQSDSSRAPPRGMSLPMPGQQLAPRSPNQKKHKCPYCETEFTRHHNLKSHLLTHSQEKPYVCQTCSMRFRRLHDLKRHMKLHTGERPHICPKCDRKFARGDALARHSKGQGGCAGRRASMGSFGGDDDFEGSNPGDGEDGMDGIMYANGTTHANDTEMTEEDRRRLSLPSIKAQHVSGNTGGGDNYTQVRTPSTYPPSGPRPGQSAGGLYPPPTRDRAGSSSSGNSPSMQNGMVSGHTPNTSISSMPLSTGSSIYSQSGMTESPKPLSPSAMQSHQLGHEISINRQRSPSLTTQFQQQHFGRRPSGRGSPPIMSLPSSHGAPQGPKLPALANLAPPEQRYTLSSHSSHQQNPQNGTHGQHTQPSLGPTSPGIYQPPPAQMTSSAPQGAPQHHGSGGGNSANLFAKDPNEMWQYVQSLENRVKELQEQVSVLENRERNKDDHINRLSEEIFTLRNQLGIPNQPQHSTTGHS